MITYIELIKGNNINDIPHSHQLNIEELLEKINLLRAIWGRPMTVTSGYRTLQDHLRIYAAKGIHPPHVPMGSKHLVGQAVDIWDPDNVDPKLSGELYTWLKKPEGQVALEKAELYCEERQGQWQHFQVRPPASGHRWFYP